MPEEVGADRLVKVAEGGTMLHRARGVRRPDALAPPPSRLAARSLCDAPVDDDKPKRLLGEIVRRLDARRRDESEAV